MVRINRQTDYAIRILLALARYPFGTRIATHRIQEEMLIPAALSHRIVARLAQGNFIQTFPGRDGGLQLSRPAAEISLLQVVDHMQGSLDVSDCLVADGEPCTFEQACPVRRRWARLRALIRDELENQNFDELATEANQVQGLPGV